jgi:hypothetical protein
MPAANVSVKVPSGTILLTPPTLTELAVNGPNIDVVYVNAGRRHLHHARQRPLDRRRASCDRFLRIPSGTAHPLRVFGVKVLLSAVTGTANAWAIAMADRPLDVAKATDPCAFP